MTPSVFTGFTVHLICYLVHRLQVQSDASVQLFYLLGSRQKGLIFSRLKQFIPTNRISSKLWGERSSLFSSCNFLFVFPVRQNTWPPRLKIEHKVTFIHSLSHMLEIIMRQRKSENKRQLKCKNGIHLYFIVSSYKSDYS